MAIFKVIYLMSQNISKLKFMTNFLQKSKICYYSKLAKFQAQKTYPDLLTTDLSQLISKKRKLQVFIFDDQAFPWTSALESKNVEVHYYEDYTRPVSQTNEKLKSYSVAKADIVICDIHGVGTKRFHDMEGLGVLEEIRSNNPFLYLIAYTGDPGLITTRKNKPDCIDKIFSRDWAIDDFLLNFDEVINHFNKPKFRWAFIRKRLTYLGATEKQIQEVQHKFVEKVLLCQKLQQKLQFDSNTTRELVFSSSNSELNSLPFLSDLGLKPIDLIGFFIPFLLEA